MDPERTVETSCTDGAGNMESLSSKSEREIMKDLQDSFARNPKDKTNFFRILTHDQCKQRHHILEPAVLETSCPLDNGHHDTPSAIKLANSSSLGALDKLPLELIHQILCDEISLSTLTRCREVNRGLRLIIDNLPQYKAIVTYAPSSLRGTLSLCAGRYTGLRELYEALCSEKCNTCGKFGPYLHVLNCKRVCFNCFTTDFEYLPLKWTHAQSKYLIKATDIMDYGVNTVKSLPGQYEVYSKKRERARIPLIGMYDAVLVAACVHGSVDRVFELAEEKEDERWEMYEARTLIWETTPENQLLTRSARPPSLPPFANYRDREVGNPHRFMCIVGFPWLNRIRGVAEWGVACNGCKLNYAKLASLEGDERKKCQQNANVLYSEEGYIHHYVDCKASRETMDRSMAQFHGREILLQRLCNVAGDPAARSPKSVWRKSNFECPIPPQTTSCF